LREYFFNALERERIAKNCAERSNYRVARDVTILLIFPAKKREKRKKKREKEKDCIMKESNETVTTITIGHSLFSALLRRKRVAQLRVKT